MLQNRRKHWSLVAKVVIKEWVSVSSSEGPKPCKKRLHLSAGLLRIVAQAPTIRFPSGSVCLCCISFRSGLSLGPLYCFSQLWPLPRPTHHPWLQILAQKLFSFPLPGSVCPALALIYIPQVLPLLARAAQMFRGPDLFPFLCNGIRGIPLQGINWKNHKSLNTALLQVSFPIDRSHGYRYHWEQTLFESISYP